MADMEGKVCPNHPDEAAVSRCLACFKPLCQECIIKTAGNDFCSDQCAANHASTSETYGNAMANESRRKRKKLIKNIVLLIVIVTLAAFGYKWYQGQSPEQRNALKNRLNDAKETAIDKAGQAQDKYDNAIDEKQREGAELGDKQYGLD